MFLQSSGRTVADALKRQMQQILGKGKTRENTTPKDTPRDLLPTMYHQEAQRWSLSDNWRKNMPPPHLSPASDTALFVAKMRAQRENEQAYRVSDDARAHRKQPWTNNQG